MNNFEKMTIKGKTIIEKRRLYLKDMKVNFLIKKNPQKIVLSKLSQR